MNLKAKTEWRRSGERAGASTGPAQATGLATHLLLLSSSATWLFLRWFCPVATLLGSPFPQRVPTPQLSRCGPLSSGLRYCGSRSPGYLFVPRQLLLSSL